MGDPRIGLVRRTLAALGRAPHRRARDRAGAQAEVRAAYRWILGREAEDAGLQGYCALLESGALDRPGLRQTLLRSAEFARSTADYRVVEIGQGVKVVVDPHEPEFGRAIAAHGGWEPHIVAAIRATLAPGDCFVDVGGNVGIMSFNAAAVVGPEGRVIAFEPGLRNGDAFRRGILANRFRHVILHGFALSDRRQMLTVTGASNGKVAGKARARQGGDVIQAVTGDEILAHEPRIDLVKIDIEGWELPALRGLRHTLTRHRPMVLCEFNPLCLREQGGIDGAVLADFIFALTPAVEVVEHDGGRTALGSADALMALWGARNAEAVAAGVLPDGWTHFDLLFRAA